MPIETMIRKLRQHSELSNEDVEALRSIIAPAKNLPEDTPIVHDGDISTHCCVILSGFAYRSKVSEDGQRQILSFHIAGDTRSSGLGAEADGPRLDDALKSAGWFHRSRSARTDP